MISSIPSTSLQRNYSNRIYTTFACLINCQRQRTEHIAGHDSRRPWMSAHEEFVIERSHRSKNLVLVGHAKDDGECMSNSRELCHYLHDCVASTLMLVIQLKDEYRVLVASDVI
jgi:hypothetical protein